MLNICIVITNYCTWTDTIECVESIFHTKQECKYIIIVDNASNNDSVKNLTAFIYNRSKLYNIKFKIINSVHDIHRINFEECIHSNNQWIFLVKSEKNCGYAGGNNIGILLNKKLNAYAVWFLNNDIVVAPGAAKAMYTRLFSARRPGLAGSLILYYFNPNLIQCRAGGFTNKWTFLSKMNGHVMPLEKAHDIPDKEIEKSINFIYGASVMASKEFIDQIGPMDERLFLYCEEQDWAWSAEGKFDLVYAKDAIVFHKEGTTTGMSKRARPIGRLLLLSRNKILVGSKHNIIALPIIFICIIYSCARLLLRRVLDRTLPVP